MTSARKVIVNADDFGQSHGINRGIIQAHESGIVTSTSLMVRWPAAAEAAEYSGSHPSLSVGLHYDFGEWTYAKGQWEARYQVVDIEDVSAVDQEARRQLAEFRRLVDRDPTHFDSHQHVHRSEPVRSIVARIAAEMALPLRHFSPHIKYCGSFYGQMHRGEPHHDAIRVDGLIAVLRGLPSGLTELACHPGLGEDVASTYLRERAIEVHTLCDPRVRTLIESEGIELCSFRDAIHGR